MFKKLLGLAIASASLTACAQPPTHTAPAAISGLSMHGVITTVVQLSTLSSDFITQFNNGRFHTTPKSYNALSKIDKNSGTYQYKKLNGDTGHIVFKETKGNNVGLQLTMTLTFKTKKSGTFSGAFLHATQHPQSGRFTLSRQQPQAVSPS
jgi:hypothetical protein